MIRLYGIDEAEQWDAVVRSFAAWDVYYLSGYVKAFQIHGDGEPYLLYYEGDGIKAIDAYMKRRLAIEGVYDIATPYGYGGVLFEGDTSERKLQLFWAEYLEAMRRENIVDGFVRYHPVLKNATLMKLVSDVVDLSKTVAIDLSSPEVIWKCLSVKNHNMIRKSERNGIEIKHGRGLALLEHFRMIYNSTMERDNAQSYYYFGPAFYESIHNDLKDHYEVFYALLNGEIIAMSIILTGSNQMHYHLAGSKVEYRDLAPSNLLLYKAAIWGFENGFKFFHLGGGVGSGEDNVYKFKAAFNRKSNYQFSVGKQIYDQGRYDACVALRASQDPVFNPESAFFPLYRA